MTLAYNLRHACWWSVTLLLPCLGWLRHSHSRLLLLLVNHAHRLTVDPTNTLDKLRRSLNHSVLMLHMATRRSECFSRLELHQLHSLPWGP